MKFTQSYLDKLQDILSQSDFAMRYERGTFQSGWCLLEQKRIVVLNKFLDTEGIINWMLCYLRTRTKITQHVLTMFVPIIFFHTRRWTFMQTLLQKKL